VPDREAIEVQGRSYTVQFERHIVRSQREVVAMAFNSDGKPVMQWATNTGAARAYLGGDSDGPASWEQLEEIALSQLKLELEQ
jgi:hypothetical protein